MTSKKYIFTIVIILFLVGLSAVNATENTTTDDTSNTATQHTTITHTSNIQNTDLNQEKIETKTIKTLNKTRQTDTKEATTVNNFASLYDELTRDDSTETVSISLEGDTKYTITDHIILNKNIKNLTIEGNGRIIDGNNQHQFLYINQSCNLVINNLTIQNCNLEENPQDVEYEIGGALELNYGKVLLNNTRFISNNLTAVYVVPDLFMISADMDNPSLDEVSNLTILNSEFDSNYAEQGSSIVYMGSAGSTFYVGNSTFTSNGKKDEDLSESGAISIFVAGNVTIEDSVFDSNFASMGGALYAYHMSNEQFIINNCSFNSNHAILNSYESMGGAAFISSIGDVTINNTRFDSNSADNYGALIINGYGTSNILNTTFNGNVANNTGGALGYIQMSEYERESIAESIGLDITGKTSVLNINNTYFINNTLKKIDSYGGAIIVENTNLTLNNSLFQENYAIKGGSLYYNDTTGVNLLIKNSTFKENVKNEEDDTIAFGVIYIQTNGNTTITGSTIKDNFAEYSGVIYYDTEDENSYLIINDTKFDSNGVLDESLDAAALTIQKTYNTSINNSQFTSNNASYGAIIASNYGTFNVENTLFDSNNANYAGGALNVFNNGNMSLKNNTFRKNYGYDAGAVDIYGYANTTLNISDSEFDSNGGYSADGITLSKTSVMRIETLGETSITNSNFHDNIGGNEGTLAYNGYDYSTKEFDHREYTVVNWNRFTIDYYYLYESYTNLTIKDTNFTSNTGTNTSGVVLSDGNVTLDGVNFINNTLRSVDDIYSGNGIAILSNSTLHINNSNFEQNGLPADIDPETSKIYDTRGSAIYQMKKSIQIYNTNFTSNLGGIYGSPVVSDNGPIGPPGLALEDYYRQVIINQEIKNVIINNSKFEDNREIITDVISTPYETILEKTSPGIMVQYGSLVVDNTKFISNKVDIQVAGNGYIEEEYGVISFEGGTSSDVTGRVFEYTCNVTNSLFDDNEPSNFIIEDNMIRLKPGYANSMINGMTDNYIPTIGNVTIYVDDNPEPIKAELTSNESETFDIWGYVMGSEINDIRIDYQIPETAVKLRVIIDQDDEQSFYSGFQDYYNNEYIFIVPHNYTLTVNATSPVEFGENTTIKGKAYFSVTDGEVVSTGDLVKLYINGTYIANTTTNETGEYEFNYTTTTLGTQNITIELNMTTTSLILTNNTTFDVNIQTRINIEVNDTNPGIETLIKGNLTDINNKTMPNTNITIYVNTIKYDLTTDNNGEFTIPYTPTTLGNNYVLAFYQGNTTHIPSSYSKTFLTEKINTTTKAIPVNQEVGNITFNIKVEGKDEKIITNGKIIIYDENGRAVASADINGEETNVTITETITGTHTFNITYTGNDTYNPSNNTQRVTITVLPTPEITIEIINHTQSNVIINYTATLEDNPLGPDIEIEITLPNGTITTRKTDKDGKITITDTTTPVGEYNTTATITATDTYNGSNSTKEVYITENIQPLIDELEEAKQNITTLQEQLENNITALNKANEENQELKNNLTQAQNQIQNLTQDLKEANKTIENLTEKLEDAQKTIKTLNETNKALNNTINNLTGQLKEAENTIDTLNKSLAQANQKVENLTDELNNANQKVENLTQQLTNAENENKELMKELEQAKQDVQKLKEQLADAQKEIKTLNDTINNLEEKVEKLEDTLETMNKTSIITAVAENRTVDDNNVIVTLDNKMGTPITNAPITVKNSKGETIGTASTNEKGVAIIPLKTTAGTEDITITYPGNDNFTPVNTTVKVTTSKNNVMVTVDPVNGIIGEKITLTAHITDTKGNPVSGGNLVFKLNGKTLRTDGRFDSNASAQKFKVTNGIVTVTITADLYLRNAKNLTASYSGTYKYEEAKSSTVTAQIKKRDAKITVTVNPKSQKQYKTITFTATLTDKTPNTKNTTAMNIQNKVLFKINGKTIKDKDGKNLLVKISDNTAAYKYAVPAGMGGVTKEGATRNYDVEAILISDTYYPDTRDTTTFNVQRSPVTINVKEIQVNKDNRLSIKADIKDYKGKYVIGDNTVNIKINGKSYVNPKTNKTENFKVANGKINLNKLQVSGNIAVKKITIVTGARQAYLGQRNETSNIIKV